MSEVANEKRQIRKTMALEVFIITGTATYIVSGISIFAGSGGISGTGSIARHGPICTDTL